MMHIECIYTDRPKDANKKHLKFGAATIRLTAQTDYALRILLHAAKEPDARLAIANVAQIHGISRNHVMKVVNTLANAGLLATVRGRGGGFTLGRAPETITLGEVVRLTEPSLRPADCANCVLRGICGLTPMLESAVGAFLAELDKRTLADAARATSNPFLALGGNA